MAFTGVLSLHHMKHLVGHVQDKAARDRHATEGWNTVLTYLFSDGLVGGKTKLECHQHKALNNSWKTPFAQLDSAAR